MLLPNSVIVLVFLLIAPKETNAGRPAPAQFYHEAIIDHFPDDPPPFLHQNSGNDSSFVKESFWSQRYYATDEHFQGPGSPIFCIMGGEGAIPPTTGFMYPLITDHFAATLGAGVVQPEHRFYGASQPIPRSNNTHSASHPDPRVRLLTYEQALYDAARLVQHIRESWGCAMDDRISPDYCPVITVGGSYPGFLAAMMRIVRPDIVDMAYSASAPMKFYAQQVSQDAYYTHIAAVADVAVPGCSNAVRETLGVVLETFAGSQEIPAKALGVCVDTVPDYLLEANDVDFFLEELFMIVAFTFANHNMAYYPPSPEAALARSCNTFLLKDIDPVAKLSRFLTDSLPPTDDDSCFSMESQVPAGPNATISGGDWSGVGSGISGDSWDFQTCTLCVEAIGLVDEMFPYRPWSFDWLSEHCQRRYGVTPKPLAINRRWGIHNLKGNTNANHILFTNGLNDGWSVSGIQQGIAEKNITVINFPNGAHHSDLSGRGPSVADTPDIVEGFKSALELLTQWLDDLPSRKQRRIQTSQ